jgi:hypothetical protein
MLRKDKKNKVKTVKNKKKVIAKAIPIKAKKALKEKKVITKKIIKKNIKAEKPIIKKKIKVVKSKKITSIEPVIEELTKAPDTLIKEVIAEVKVNYVDKKELTKHLKIFHDSFDRTIRKGNITEELGDMFYMVAKNLANHRKFINYTYKDEMVSRGLLFLCQYSHNFNADHPKANAFSYVTKVCINGFIQCIKDEKKQSATKDSLIKRAMENTIMDDYMSEGFGEES